mgnify:CR=1 FL=1
MHSQVRAQEVALEGKWMLGGSVGFTSNDRFYPSSQYQSLNAKSITFSPTFGYFLNNRWQVGIQGQYQHGQNDQDWYSPLNRSGIENSSKSIGLGAYVRRYIWMFDHLAFYIEANVAHTQTISNAHQYYSNNVQNRWKSQQRSVMLSLTPGFTLKVHKRIGIDLSTNLLRVGQETEEIQNTTNQEPDQKMKTDEWKRTTFNATLSNFEALLNDVQIGITIFI